MRKGIVIFLMTMSAVSFATQDVVIDKEVTGVNKEQLEAYPKDNVKLDKKTVKLKDENITENRYKNQKQVLSVKEKDETINKSLTETEGTPIWKYILGAVALITLGVAL